MTSFNFKPLIVAALAAWLALAASLAQAQNAAGRTAPVAPGTAPSATAPMLPGSIDPPGGIAPGQGAGVHGANSPFAPLADRADVVPWSVLTDIKTRIKNKRILPVFNDSQLGLDKKVQRIQGFMMPLEAGDRHKRFLLSSVPLTCGFCLPGGPESMVEVRTTRPLKYSMEAVVVEGKFLVLPDDELGLYYRMVDAVAVK
jgi:hypothetical protein